MFLLGLILIINIICWDFFQFSSLQLAVVYINSYVQEARRHTICDILPSFRNSIISTSVIFLCDSWEWNEARWVHKENLEHCPHYLHWHLSVFPKPQLICQLWLSAVFPKPSIKDDFPVLQLDIWPSNMHIFHSLVREFSEISAQPLFIRAPHRWYQSCVSRRQTSTIWTWRAVLTMASSMSKPNVLAAEAMGFM